MMTLGLVLLTGAVPTLLLLCAAGESPALDFTPVPNSFVVIGQIYDWNWEHVQRYEIAYTANLRLVAAVTPVGGEEP